MRTVFAHPGRFHLLKFSFTAEFTLKFHAEIRQARGLKAKQF